jgi:hypothetical protein
MAVIGSAVTGSDGAVLDGSGTGARKRHRFYRAELDSLVIEQAVKQTKDTKGNRRAFRVLRSFSRVSQWILTNAKH